MNVMMIRAAVKAETVDQLEATVKEMFAAIEQAKPEGVRYASSKLADGVTFVILLEVDDPANNPLTTVPEFRQFQENLKEWIAEPPTVEQLTVVGSYRLF